MDLQQFSALRAQVWTAPDGTWCVIVSALPQGERVIVTLSTGFSGFYDDLPSHGYTLQTTPE